MRIRGVDTQFSGMRVAAVVVTFVLAQLAYSFVNTRLIWPIFALGALVFAGLVYRHRQIRELMRRTLISHDLVTEQLGRMTLNWSAIPTGLDVPPEARTPLEVDFDLVGERSIHRLVDSAETNGGSNRLRDWLIVGKASKQTIEKRQALVSELRNRWHLRKRLALGVRKLTGGHGDWSTDGLLDWLGKPEDMRLARWLWPLIGLAIANIVLFALDQLMGWPPYWQGTLVLYAFGMIYLNREASQTFQQASYLRDVLEQMMGVFGLLETYRYRGAPNLKALCEPFWTESFRPKKSLRGVVLIVNMMGITQGNPFVALLSNLLFPFTVFLTVQLGKQKALLRERLPIWTETWYELETLSSLANFAWLSPELPMPTLVDDGPLVMAQAAGHPLIPDDEKVRNDFDESQLGALTIITGSNMSGKSTFLRTLGVNAVLAFAGSVVDAQRFDIRPMRLYSCIKVSDSVTDGFSYFYAEVRRLKGLLESLESAEALPVLYFVDEIFRGTNNRERLIGSRSLVKAMAGLDGIGFISTHDLELVQLADNNQHIRNSHFREHIVDGEMQFDYTLREGPSPTTNALKIMRLAGLPIDVEPNGDDVSLDAV